MPVQLFHETGANFARNIIETGRIWRRSSPYLGEFTKDINHSAYRDVGSFRGRGILLEFSWSGEVDAYPFGFIHDRPDQASAVRSHNCLYDFFNEFEPNIEMGHGRYKGIQGTLKYSGIFSCDSGLTLVAATLRTEMLDDYRNNIERKYSFRANLDIVSDLNKRIGNGMPIIVKNTAPPEDECPVYYPNQ